MKWSSLKFVLTFVFMLASQEALSWAHHGHKIICDIAWRQATQSTKQQISALLKKTGYSTFAESCTWADQIRSVSSYDYAKPHHYINVPKGQLSVKVTQECRARGCVVLAIEAYTSVLKGLSAGPGKYAKSPSQALMFLGHFVGDVHQPLHVSFAEDRGGNLIKLKFNDEDTNLHVLWDYHILVGKLSKTQNKKISWRSIGKKMHQEVRALDSNALSNGNWSSLDTMLWANESYGQTLKIYKDLPQKGQIDQSYIDKYYSIVDLRLKKAGYRLGQLLNSIFDAKEKDR